MKTTHTVTTNRRRTVRRPSQVSAYHALSDVEAMGAIPISALAARDRDTSFVRRWNAEVGVVEVGVACQIHVVKREEA